MVELTVLRNVPVLPDRIDTAHDSRIRYRGCKSGQRIGDNIAVSSTPCPVGRANKAPV